MNELCILQHFHMRSRRKKNTDLRFAACTWGVRDILQLFSHKIIIHVRTLHTLHPPAIQNLAHHLLLTLCAAAALIVIFYIY